MTLKKNMNKGILTNADLKLPKYKALYWSMFTLMLLYCVVCGFPVIWILLSGFKDVKEMYAIPASLFPKEIKLSKLADVWNSMQFYKYYINTFIMALGSVIADILVCGLAGYSLSRLKPKGTKFILTVFFWVLLMPGTMRTVSLYKTFINFPILGIKLTDSYIPIWLMAAANVFDIILFKNFFDGISKSLVEAAQIDGAGNMNIFFKIILPLSVPVFMTVTIFTFNGSVGQFFWPYLLITKKELTVLGVQLFNMKSSTFTMDYQMLALLFSILPQLIIFVIFQKKIIGGINIGGVKG
ncbi:MAG: carbohydrate ABC transporter permease [Clostridia bacterium]|nr:carbohydrate ABC transporter permease [Clostridia bacterium]